MITIVETSQALPVPANSSYSFSSSCWSDLPIDILCQVADRLPYWDLVHSAAVCKTWRLVIHAWGSSSTTLHLARAIFDEIYFY